MTGARRWIRRWRPLLPVLIAEFIILLGFGALLPVLPLFVVEHGIDVPTLGLIAAAWSIAKLVAEPIFGYLADRTSRKPFLVGGAVVLGIATMLPIVFTSAAALFVLRFISGAAAGAYDPAARGMIVDATEEGERGEAFGIYAAFQMGGFVLGPVIGAFGAAVGGGFAFPFLFTGVLTLGAAVLLAFTVPSQPHVVDEPAAVAAPGGPVQRVAPSEPPFSATTAGIPAADEAPGVVRAPLRDLLNVSMGVALIMNFGFSLAFGVYEVIWSLFLEDLGASIEWIGLTFALFGLPMMIVSPWAGRLVDRFGPIRFAGLGGFVICLAGVVYAISTEPVLPSLIVPVEAVAEAFLLPALYALVAFGSPSGRSSTAQGIFGAVGTIGLIVATLSAGWLWELGRAWPFVFFVVGSSACLVLGLALYRFGGGARAVHAAGQAGSAT
jgi:DHA1 family multidrug resistance protein-like MFS transporter